MNISPLDIRKHEFRKVMRGYDPEDVSAFLDMISGEFENMVRTNAQLSEKNAMQKTQIDKYREMERTLQDSLVTAQRAGEDTIDSAKRQADLIIREAEVKAVSIIEDGRIKLSRIMNVIADLRVHKDTYLTKLRALTESQLELFDRYAFPEEEKFDTMKSAFDEHETEKPKPNVEHLDVPEDDDPDEPEETPEPEDSGDPDDTDMENLLS